MEIDVARLLSAAEMPSACQVCSKRNCLNCEEPESLGEALAALCATLADKEVVARLRARYQHLRGELAPQ